MPHDRATALDSKGIAMASLAPGLSGPGLGASAVAEEGLTGPGLMRAGIAWRPLLCDPAVACVTLFLALFAVLLARILRFDQGHFSYALDDPYIHLALAERLAHGLYSLNLGEIEAPSSSILWPFLLIPGAGKAWHPYLPLAYNLVFGALSALLIGRMARGWLWLRTARFPVLACWSVSLLLVLGANLAALAFTGLEHSFQVLLAVACAWGVMEAYAGRPVPGWCIAAAIAAPALRYESYTLSIAVAAAAVLTASLIVPALFALFLVRHGLPPLPSSVLVKGGAFASSKGVLANLGHSIADNFSKYLLEYHRWPMTILVPILGAVLWRERKNPLHRTVLGGVAVALLLHVVMGDYGWFYRYEAYSKALAILALLTATAAMRGRAFLTGVFACLLFADIPYIKAIASTPVASQNIYDQQYQMHRFAQMYGGNFAVNDLGWVSYQAKPSVYILDLAGLASPESMRQVDKSPWWLDDITRRHGCGLVMVYPGWVPVVPADWAPLGRLSLPIPNISGGEDDVYFYETPFGTAQEREELPGKLQTFVATLPPGVKFNRDLPGQPGAPPPVHP